MDSDCNAKNNTVTGASPGTVDVPNNESGSSSKSCLKPVKRCRPGPACSKKGQVTKSRPVTVVPNKKVTWNPQLEKDVPHWWPEGVAIPKRQQISRRLTTLRRNCIKTFLLEQSEDPFQFGKVCERKWLDEVLSSLKHNSMSCGNGVEPVDVLYWLRYDQELATVFRNVYQLDQKVVQNPTRPVGGGGSSLAASSTAESNMAPEGSPSPAGLSGDAFPEMENKEELQVVPNVPLQKMDVEAEDKQPVPAVVVLQQVPRVKSRILLPPPPPVHVLDSRPASAVPEDPIKLIRAENGILVMQTTKAMPAGMILLVQPGSWSIQAIQPSLLPPPQEARGDDDKKSNSDAACQPDEGAE